MSYSPEICAHVIENVALVEEAQEVLAYAEEQLVEKIWTFIGKITEEQEYFDVICDKNGDRIVSGHDWEKKDDGMPIAGFWLDCQGDGCEKSWFSVLAGIVPGTTAGLFFWYDWSVHGIKRKDWKVFLKDFFIKNPGLGDNGFVLNEDGTAIMRPLKIDLACLAEHFQNPECCLDSMNETLEAIYAEREVFEKLLKDAAKISSN